RRVSYGFFFSSRRRHTRFSRDWSSDVCSSDLYVPEQLAQLNEVYWITRVPAQLKEARALLRAPSSTLCWETFDANYRGSAHNVEIGRASCREEWRGGWRGDHRSDDGYRLTLAN